MSAYKYIIGLAVLITALLTVTAVPTANGTITSYADKSHNLIVGSRQPGDSLAFKESVFKNSGWLKVQEVEKTFSVSQWQTITMVEALDQKTNGNGAYASILNGGPGYNSVTIKFKSQRGHSINFIVQLYAR